MRLHFRRVVDGHIIVVSFSRVLPAADIPRGGAFSVCSKYCFKLVGQGIAASAVSRSRHPPVTISNVARSSLPTQTFLRQRVRGVRKWIQRQVTIVVLHAPASLANSGFDPDRITTRDQAIDQAHVRTKRLRVPDAANRFEPFEIDGICDVVFAVSKSENRT